MLAILAPMPTELRGIRRRLGRPNPAQLSLHVAGIGRPAASAAAAQIAAGADAILMVGFCGAASPHLATGDLHAAAAFQCADGAPPIPAAATLLAAIHSAAQSSNAPVSAAAAPSITTPAIANAAAKQTLWRQHGAASVNMEDYWVAQAAQAANIPFASIRAVLDTAEQTIPDYIGSAAAPASIAMQTVAHPGRLPQLARLAGQAQVARRSLTRCVTAFVAAYALSNSLAGAVRV